MWFRADLRVRDNTALDHACKAADEGVLAVFTICPEQWAEHDWGSMKVDFVLRSLSELSAALGRLNIPLKLIHGDRFADVPGKLLHLAQKHKCDALYFNAEYEVNEQARDREVAALLHKRGIPTYSFSDQMIFDVGEIRTGTGGWYTVFTPFKRKWYATLEEHGPPEIRRKPRRQKPIDIPCDDVPGHMKGFTGHRRPDLWPAGEEAALKRLDRFVAERIERYDRDRDLPALEGTSALSPHLALGVVSPRQCLEAAIVANNGVVDAGNKGVVTWIGELIWREFYRHILMGFPQVCRNQPFKPETDDLPWRYDEKDFQAWCDGRTGVPIVDAGMRQLAETGWMHNRVRMIVAMFLTKDLFIDWRWGEGHFMRHLVDGDFASNNGGWQWSASTGTDAVPYFRVFNPSTQSRRYDPRGEYIRRFVPELAALSDDAIHEPSPTDADAVGYPRPIVDRRKTKDKVIAAFKGLKRDKSR